MTHADELRTPTIRVNILIRGDFDPDLFTKETGINPSFIWRKGDPWPTNVRLRDEDGWVVRFETKRAWHLGEEVAVVLDYLERYPEIAIVAHARGLEGTIRADIDIHTAGEVAGYPGMYFEPSMIERIHKTGFGVDLDQVGVDDFTSAAN